MLVGGVVDDELGDDPDAALMRRLDEDPEVVERPVGRVDVEIFLDVVAVVPQRRGIERHQPDRRHAEIADVVELRGHAGEVADPVVVGIEEGLDVDLIDQGVAVPLRVGAVDHVYAVCDELKGACLRLGKRDRVT